MRYHIKYVKRIQGGGSRWQGMNRPANRSQHVGLKMKSGEIRVAHRQGSLVARKTVRHEITEARAMNRGVPYERAHRMGLRAEKDVR